MKTYVGVRENGQCRVFATCGEEGSYPLDPCLFLRNHSPDGFNWGYGGSGPAQLALALLVDVLGDPWLAEVLYQDFKFKVIAGLAVDSWELTVADIQGWVSEAVRKDPSTITRAAERERMDKLCEPE